MLRNRKRLILLAVALGLFLYVLSFLHYGQAVHLSWMVPTSRGFEAPVPYPPQHGFYFSHDHNWNRVAYCFYFPLARPLELTGEYMFLDHAERAPGGSLSWAIRQSIRERVMDSK